jgi:dienelactone hydrolase
MPDAATPDAGGPPVTLVPVNGASLRGQLAIPPSPMGLAVIAKLESGGPGPDAYAAIVRAFLEKRFAALLVSLDAPGEAPAGGSAGWLRPDVALIAERIAAAIRWASAEPQTARLPIGLFGVDVVAAASLVAAADGHPQVSAVVVCNARTDLVDRVLGRIAVPTLLIAGTRATEVVTANRAALAELSCEKRMVIAAGNLKESLEGRGARRVANLAARWFDRHVTKRVGAAGMR